MSEHLPRVNLAGTGYVRATRGLMNQTFQRAMSFHLPEALAAVADDSGAYHITADGTPAYNARFVEAYGFYCAVATVRDADGYFHIDPGGKPVHGHRFLWAGNFQEGLCAVQDTEGFYHIGLDGSPAYEDRHHYVGDFRHGIAAVHTSAGALHIHPDGSRVHERTFLSASPFHKGYAVVEDSRGVYHVDVEGSPLHEHRFRAAEPFYNGVALCTDSTGRRVRLRENGYWQYLPSGKPKATAADVRQRLAEGWSVGLLLRHAERERIADGWGEEAVLTPKGLGQAKALGRLLAGRHSIRTLSSPIRRCIQTAVAVADGAGRTVSPKETTLLGDPGPFHDLESGRGPAVSPKEFGDFATRYIKEGRAPGMLPLESACSRLLTELQSHMSEGLTVFATHDLFVAGLTSFLGLKTPSRHDWADYLEGVCLYRAPDGRTEWRRFLGLEEIARC